MFDRSDTALVALRRILRATELSSRTLARQSGLTTSQLIVLQIIARSGRTTPGAVAQAARLSQATITALVDRLEGRGLVTRRRDTEDRRRIWVELTEQGNVTLVEAPDTLQDRFRTRFDQLEDWEQAFIIAALERVAALLDAAGIDASPVLDLGAIDRQLQERKRSADP